jgi:hypothetical protein
VKKIACSSFTTRVSHGCGDAEVHGEGDSHESSAERASCVTARR